MTIRATSNRTHTPVLLREVIQSLNIVANGLYVDATYGRGGHSRAILDELNGHGRLVSMDRDPDAVAHARAALGGDSRCTVVHGELRNIDREIEALKLEQKASGILADLGVSSPQLEDPERGFGFTSNGPLDMRMDPSDDLNAAQWLNQVEEKELIKVLREYGEERYAKRITRAVLETRKEKPLTSTGQLAELIRGVVPSSEKNKHPATRTFQAIRIRINAELDQLAAFLPKAVRLLAEGGRLVVISFHSLEDRLVKRFMREQARGDPFPASVPVPATQLRPLLRLVGKPCRPTPGEIEVNPRARSAVLRVAERTAL